MSLIITKNFKRANAQDAAEFHVGQRVRAKDPRWTGYQGHALGNGIYTVKKVDRDGTVKLDGFLDVWISPSSLVEANDACGKGEDAKFQKGDLVKINPSSTLMKLYGPKRLEWRGRVVGYGVKHDPIRDRSGKEVKFEIEHNPVIEWERPCPLGREPIHEMHIVAADACVNE